MVAPSLADRVVLPKDDPLLASIATCLLLQASILSAGWLLQGWCARTEPLQGQAATPAQLQQTGDHLSPSGLAIG